MKYSVIPTPKFKNEAKRLIKKFPSLKSELYFFEQELSMNPYQGIPLGQNAYKIRLAIKSKGKGKSGGARVITFVINEQEEVYLLSLYDKSEIENIDDKILRKLISEVRSH
jgi:mRNA-degrading endonuclease RelE of RelBE toxin-antitoxin system